MEYFCFEHDGFWNLPDADLLALAKREIAELGLVRPGSIVDGTVVRMPKAYPIYDDRYERGLAAVRRFLAEEVPNLQLVGRNGMHRYNNQDHSMLTGILAARNVMGASYDLWGVNVDADYLEEYGSRGGQDYAALSETQPMVPRRISAGA
jgi:protoporphyrinogen oxidase